MSRPRTSRNATTPVVDPAPSQIQPWKAWCQQPKITEWITAITAVIGFIVVWHSGLIDAKKAELSAQKSELSAQNQYLMIERTNLDRRKEFLTAEIAAKSKELEQAQAQLKFAERERQAVSHIFQLKKLASIKVGTEVVRFEIELSLADDENGWALSIMPTKFKENSFVLAGMDAPLFFEPVTDFLKQASYIQNIRKLTIFNTLINSQSMTYINEMHQLTQLILENCGIDDATISQLQNLDSLHYMLLSKNKLTHIPRIHAMEKITNLRLNSNLLTDESIASIDIAAPNLEFLEVPGSKISNEGAKSLARLKNLGS
ncbi:hypothetical protein P12x_000185 [Tundrisphaera lichenicola]|uniref:hypothetical protein n=1 Tax=Tundrisphaera lichenicola TaxID=2029860 RepID=UPI003EBB577E